MRISFVEKEALQSRLEQFKETLYILRKNRLTFISLLIIILLLGMAVFAPLIIPYPRHIYGTFPAQSLEAPSSEFFFGTDELGRDVFSRVIYGSRVSLVTALVVVVVGILIGVPLGIVAGYYGGIIDEIIMRITDMFLSFPPMLLAIAVAAFLGPSLQNAILAIIISWWPWFTRLVRSQTVSLKEREFVKAARSIGTSPFKIMFSHILPNSIAPVLVQASMDMGGVILTTAALSFLGLGAQPPTPEWGLMINISMDYFLEAWWVGIFPGIAIFITVMAFNLLGDGLREALDPRTRGY